MSLQQQQQLIDEALEKYLHCVHQYSLLRETLSDLQAQTFANIARANFTAERGVRYDRDYYDGRMRVLRILSISAPTNDDGSPVFSVKNASAAAKQNAPDSNGDSHEHCKQGDEAPTYDEKQEGAEGRDNRQDDTRDDKREDEQDDKQDDKHDDKSKQELNPLRWFGILTPQALRQAQATSITVIEQLVPQLASVMAEMRQLEIAVRRARKVRAKMVKNMAHVDSQSDSGAKSSSETTLADDSTS